MEQSGFDREDAVSRETPVFRYEANDQQALRHQALSDTAGNFLVHELSRNFLLENPRLEPTFWQSVGFNLQYLLENRQVYSSRSRASVQDYCTALVRNTVTAFDFDRVNNRIAVLFRSNGVPHLLVQTFLSEPHSQDAIYRLESFEPLFLDVKFYCPLSKDLVLIMGLARVYLVALGGPGRSGEAPVLDLTADERSRVPRPLPRPDSSFVTSHRRGASERLVGLEPEHFITRTFRNVNYTNLSVTKGSSFVVFWSRLSKQLTVLNTATNETFTLTCEHFFDTVRVSQASFDKVLCYSQSEGRRRLSVLNLKAKSVYLLHIREQPIRELLGRGFAAEEAALLSSNSELEAKFYGKSDSVVVLTAGLALFYFNKSYERDYLETQVSRMRYELNNGFSIRQMFVEGVANQKRHYSPDARFRVEVVPREEAVVIYTIGQATGARGSSVDSVRLNWKSNSHTFRFSPIAVDRYTHNFQDSLELKQGVYGSLEADSMASNYVVVVRASEHGREIGGFQDIVEFVPLPE